MIEDQKFSCTRVLGAEILMFITSITISIVSLNFSNREEDYQLYSQDTWSIFLSMGYALFLPLMSYLLSQAKQYNPEGRAQIILIWMVLVEIIRVINNFHSTWQLWKSMEQLVRLFWVGYLVYGYAHLHGLRVSLLVLCIYYAVLEIMKGIMLIKANDSYQIGKNPKLIQNYMKRVMLEDDLQTTPMNNCDYIVLGEEDHEIEVCNNGYHLGNKKSNSGGVLTIGRVFQLNSEDEAFTSEFPYWRDNYLSYALAKMLRRRFAKLPVDEVGCKKALNFVLEGLINYIGNNRDIQTDGNNLERKSINRVFSIIEDELKYVYEFLHTNLLAHQYFRWYICIATYGLYILLGTGIYLIYTIFKRSFMGRSHVAQIAYSDCFFHVFSHGSTVVKIFSGFDKAITILLVFACLYVQHNGWTWFRNRWVVLGEFNLYIKNPAKWKNIFSEPLSNLRKRRLSYLEKQISRLEKQKGVLHFSILDLEPETILFCIKVDVSTLIRLPKCIRRNIPRSFPTVIHNTDAKEAILESLKKSVAQLSVGETSLKNFDEASLLTNGKTSIENYNMESLNWACKPNGSTTEAILVWHIATALFHIQQSPPQNNDSLQNHNSFNKEQKVAFALSNYCHYLVKSHPELLPDEVDCTEEMYERVTKQILDYARVLDPAMLVENTIFGKGFKLAKDLVECARDGKLVWMMLAEFWAEMMLFIAPSDNVEGHKKILDQVELITQLWALLTHAGIVTRPKTPEHQVHESESNAVTAHTNV